MSDAPKPGMVSIRDIAAKVGCSHASVSRALRGEKKVGKELRARIQKTAEEMGYKPNPMVASLMATQNMKRHRESLTANIGWLNTHFRKDFWQIQKYNIVFIKAAEARAKQLGYGFEEVWATEEGMTGRRLMEIANARGIQGFIVPGPFAGSFEKGFEIERYAFACLKDYQNGQLAWNRASVSARKNVVLAYESLQKKGYKRIGCAIASGSGTPESNEINRRFNEGVCRDPNIFDNASFRAVLSGYHYIQDFVEPENRLRPFLYERVTKTFRDALVNYLDAVRPEAIISNDSVVLEAANTAGLKVPDELAVAHLNINEDVEGWSGIHTYSDRQASTAVDMLIAQIERNERGVPLFPKEIHVEGTWVDGWTAPNKA